VLAVTYALLVPAWESPDEPSHFRFVRHIVLNGTLPIQRKDVFGEEHQAPLYYLLASQPARLADLKDRSGEFRWNRAFGLGGEARMARAQVEGILRGHGLGLRVVRLVSVLMAAMTVAITASLAAAIVPALPRATAIAAALVAFNPQFVFISASANNDNLLNLCFTGCLLQLVRLQMSQGRGGRQEAR
jgi:4-amino-4-deoxy-L-arabinose transferase-like glycosyltransferase